jgi:hypothetical protein
VDASANNGSPLIVVPDTSDELNDGSVNRQQGLLDGQLPGTFNQAQLLNTDCQVA